MRRTGPGRVLVNLAASWNWNANASVTVNGAGRAGRVCLECPAKRRGRGREDDIGFGPWQRSNSGLHVVKAVGGGGWWVVGGQGSTCNTNANAVSDGPFCLVFFFWFLGLDFS